MHLVRLELSGFKSFAQRTVLQFGSGLTAVIGPNGSGKSNLAEAIKWVLGEQSIKQLRGHKSEDIIYAGHGSRKPGSAASVTLVFNNETGWIAHPAAEVALQRILTRQGEGDYLLNGDSIRLFDLQHLLAGAGIGAKSYTVIHQGTIHRYLEATPLARRELFDEATGIRALQLKLGKAQRHLRQTQQKSQELTAILHELEPRVRVLERQVTRYRQRTDVERQLAAFQERWFHHQWQNLAHIRHSLGLRVEEALRRSAAAHTDRESIEAELWKVLEHTTPDESSALREQLHKARASFERAHADYERLHEEKSLLKQLVEEAGIARQSAEQELAAARQHLAQESWLASVRTVLHRCYEMLHQLKAGTTPASYTVRTLLDDTQRACTHFKDDQTVVAAAQTLLDKLEHPLTAVARWEALEHERRQRWQELVVPSLPDSAQLNHLQQQLARHTPSASTSSASYQKQLESARAKERTAEQEYTAAHAALDHAETTCQQLEGDILRERGSGFLHTVQYTLPVELAPRETVEALEAQVTQFSMQLASFGDPDPLALKEYEEAHSRAQHLRTQLNDIQETAHNIERLMQRLQHEMRTRFAEQFSALQHAFEAHFQLLFGGGHAELTMIPVTSDGDAEQTSVEGIDIVVHPPGKRARHLNLLSGGEKTLTSLALLFAILEVQKPPFIVLDEVDAALDDANSYRFAQLLKEKSATTQCIVITHNRETMASADVLYGVTMDQQGVSKIYSVKLKDIPVAPQQEEMKV